MRGRWLVLPVVAGGAILVGLIVTELALRITGLTAPPAVISVNESQFARMPGVFVPRKTRTERSSPRFPHSITVNSLGYRGKEMALVRESDVETRIFFAGDSFTWGDLVDDHETIPAQLEEGLAEVCPGTRVINAGVGGTTIDAHREMILRGMVLEPDLVLLMFYDNDIAEMDRPTFWEIMAENRRRKSQFPLSLAYATLNRTATWTVIRRATSRIATMRGGQAAHAKSRRSNDFWERSIETHRHLYAEQFRSLTQELQGKGIPFALISYPAHLRILEPGGTFDHVGWLSSLAEELDVPHLDLMPTLVDSGKSLEDLYFIPWDGHARPVGNEIAAERLTWELMGLDDRFGWCRRSTRE